MKPLVIPGGKNRKLNNSTRKELLRKKRKVKVGSDVPGTLTEVG